MGYRSDVGALFYVRSSLGNTEQIKKAEALFNVWMQTNMEDCPKQLECMFERSDSELQFIAESIKWFSSYDEVNWFTEFANKFCEELCDNEQLDGGSGLHECFAYEFARIGEELEDNEYVGSENTDWRLSINRSLSFD